MRQLIMLFALCAALVLPAPSTFALPIEFTANLIGANEVPPTGSPGTGQATVLLDLAANTMHVDVTFSGLLSPTTASHIHCCLPFPEAPGVNVGVATTTPTFPGFPLGVTAGTYIHDFDLMSLGTYNPTFVTANGGTAASAEAALVAGIEGGESYLNIHTTQFPNGEIRGDLVPEPSTLFLLGSGVAGLGGIVWRRRHRG
jgi:hypothetical protein